MIKGFKKLIYVLAISLILTASICAMVFGITVSVAIDSAFIIIIPIAFMATLISLAFVEMINSMFRD